VSGRSLRRAEPDARKPRVRPRIENARAVDAGARPEALRRRWGAPPCPWKVELQLRRWGLRLALAEVADLRGGRDRTHARTRSAPPTSTRSGIAFSRRTSRKDGRNKPQRNSCQLPAQVHGRTRRDEALRPPPRTQLQTDGFVVTQVPVVPPAVVTTQRAGVLQPATLATHRVQRIGCESKPGRGARGLPPPAHLSSPLSRGGVPGWFFARGVRATMGRCGRRGCSRFWLRSLAA